MNRAQIARIALALALIGLPAVFFFSRIGYSGTALDRTLWDAGFYPVKPPSTLVGPGSIYHVSRDGKHYTAICRADALEVGPLLERSPSEEIIARELQKARYGLGVDPSRLINGKLDSDLVESVHYTLSGVSVLQISLERNDELLVKLAERQACQRVIDRLLAQRQFVCQGQSVLSATVEYHLATKTSAGGSATVTPDNAPKVKAALEATLNTSIDVEEGRFIAGAGLHYGIKVNPTCMARPGDRAARQLPRNKLERVVNFVMLDVLRW